MNVSRLREWFFNIFGGIRIKEKQIRFAFASNFCRKIFAFAFNFQRKFGSLLRSISCKKQTLQKARNHSKIARSANSSQRKRSRAPPECSRNADKPDGTRKIHTFSSAREKMKLSAAFLASYASATTFGKSKKMKISLFLTNK